ncbi:ABC transporter permease subunit [Pelagibacteraceae bacterium]|jgi:general L-amino acid transport system permease protein|nr:ABC transporter permease subunit [Pelagibacteraceae bacterium]
MKLLKKNIEKLNLFLENYPKIGIYFPQFLIILLLGIVISYFSMNASTNMAARGIETGFGFLTNKASFDIQFSLIDFDSNDSYARAYLVGLLNTLLVSGIGIFFATVIGFFVGVTRLSSNILASKVAEAYIEIFRNIPLLLQIFFWYFAILRLLPSSDNSLILFNFVFANIKGIYVPRFVWENLNHFVYGFLFSILAIYLFVSFSKKKQERTGVQVPTFTTSLIIFFTINFIVTYFGNVGLSLSYPVLETNRGLHNYMGGVSVIPELIALAFSLSLYTSTFIAECVRAGILGVDKGQKEAAASIGLTKGQILKLIVIPQALRIIIPPVTNQYLNLTKNSSLAAAIAYPDIVLVFAGTALMQTGKAIEIVSITMLTYLTLSVSISLLMNWYNKKNSIAER